VSGTAPNALDSLIAKHPGLDRCKNEIAKAREALIAAYEEGHKLLLCGNGGSAADCEHIAGELLKGFERPRPVSAELRARLAEQGREGEDLAAKLHGALPAIPLTGYTSFSSAWGNDVDPEVTFAQLVHALGQAGDALLAISTSGAARSVTLAARAARAEGLTTIGLSGGDGGTLAPLCDVCILVPGGATAEIQELHLPVYHYLCRAVEAHFFTR
jgi:D-sedoheptulose 7-phosphate isomerase